MERQPFVVAGRPYANLIARFGGTNSPRIIVGAHYDACGDIPGADDNASGVAVLLELAALLGLHPPARPVELVAYTLEEPPTYGSDSMGSAVHALHLAGDAPSVRGIIVLEMVGCFDDRWGSQAYPSPLLHLIYPNRGNFIGVVGRWTDGPWIQKVRNAMRGRTALPVLSIRAPPQVPGIDMSDHRNYWPLGLPALMVTDTAYLRNRRYHTPEDTPDLLDYTAMSHVVVALAEALRAL